MLRSAACALALSSGAMLMLQGCGSGGSDGPSQPTTGTTSTTTRGTGPSGLYWCEDIGTFHKITYVSDPSGSSDTKTIAGQCLPSTTPGAYYTKPGQKGVDGKSDRPWECFNPTFDHSLWTDAAAQKQHYEGACLFKDYSSKVTPATVDLCSKHLSHFPAVCAPGPSMYWGACWSSHSENWRCIQKDDKTIPGLAKGDCKAIAVLEPAPSTEPTNYFYDGVCRLDPETTNVYKCDTVPGYDVGSSATCGQSVGDSDKACFTLKSGVQWECLSEWTDTPCDWTLLPDDSKQFYRGSCVFPQNKNYAKAIDAHNLTTTLKQQMIV